MDRFRESLVRCVGWVDRRVLGVRERFRGFRERLGDGAWRVIAPAVLVVVLLPFAIPLLIKELNEPLFGDTAMMQYTAWGIRHGLKLYKDTGSTDGPFIHFTQAIIQAFLGRSDFALRVGDIVLQITGSALMGAMLAPRRGLTLLARRLSVAAWAVTGVVVWLSYYLFLSWAATTNREAFYSVVGCAGMVALYVSGTFPRRMASLLAFAGGFALTSMCFGKPTGIVFPCTGALALLLRDPEGLETHRLRIRMALYGAAACVAGFVGALLLFGSLRGYFFWCLELPMVGNKFVWRMDWLKLVYLEHGDVRMIALLSLVVGGAAIAWGMLPARAVGFVIAPLLHWLSFCAQARGFVHQSVPVVATAHVLALVLFANLWERGGDERLYGVLASIMLVLIGYHGLQNLEASPFKWDGNPADWGKASDRFCDPEKRAGEFIKKHTSPDDRVFAYTVSPRGDNAAIILFYAERRTASPFHYSPWLDPIELLPQSEIQPNARERAALEEMQRKTRDIACKSVMSNKPPAAIAYVSLDRMVAVCPPVKEMLENDYYQADVVEDIHIFLRKSNQPAVGQ
jgi:hypothetical protein